MVRLLWLNRLTTCIVIPSLSSTATIIINIIITFFFFFFQEKLTILQAVSPGGDGPRSVSGCRSLNSSCPPRPFNPVRAHSKLRVPQADAVTCVSAGQFVLVCCFFCFVFLLLFFCRRRSRRPDGDGPAAYRSSLSTRPPGCSTGLESGKKAAFTSRPRSVRAA